MQAMLATSQTLKDKQHSKSTALFNKKPKKVKNPHAEKAPSKAQNVVISPYALDGAMSAGRTPSSSDYVPPTVFLNQMEKPEAKRNPPQEGVLADLWR